MLSQLIILAVLIFLNAFFAASEIAFISLNDTKIEKQAKDGNKKAKQIEKMLKTPSKFLATIQIGITLAGFLSSAFASDTFAEKLAPILFQCMPFLSLGVWKSISIIIITIILSFFTLVFGELVPKRLAMKNYEKIAFGTIGIIRAISIITSPFVKFLTLVTNSISKLFGVGENEEESVTEEEIKMMVDQGEEKGTIKEEEKELINNVFEFNDITDSEIMKHRKDIFAVDINISNDELMEELSKVDASTSITVSVHTSLCASSIEEFATPEQKEKWLRPLADGSKIGCFGLTEPDAGSDVAGARTVAVKDGDEYVINGSKIFTTNSGFADTFLVFALTDKAAGPHKGMSAFLIDRNTPGITVQPDIKRMGIRGASNSEVVYTDVRVPASDLLGGEGKGFKIAMKALDGGRIGIAAQSVGLAQGALDEAIAYCKERKQFGKPITAFQNTQFRIAELQARIDAARLLTWRAAVAKDNGEPYNVYAAEAKLVASDVANDVCRAAVQFMGGYGYCREYGVERKLRDVKITEIYEGTSEVMKMVISGSLLR